MKRIIRQDQLKIQLPLDFIIVQRTPMSNKFLVDWAFHKVKCGSEHSPQKSIQREERFLTRLTTSNTPNHL